MIVIRIPTTKEEFKAYYALRYKILREPLGQPRGTEKDDYEPISQHFMAVEDATGEIIGVVKLFKKNKETAQFSHLAVDDKFQKKGIGKMLVDFVENKSREEGYIKIGTLSRLTATKFYEKLGYAPMGITGVLFGKLQMMWLEKNLTE